MPVNRSGKTPVPSSRRRFLTATATVVGIGGVAAAAIPFIRYFGPSDRARAAGGPMAVDISKIAPGQQITVKWRGKPIWFLRRTPAMHEHLQAPALRARLRDPDSEVTTQQPSYAANEFRAIKPELFVVIGICTHLGCVPTFRPELGPPDLGKEWHGGYFCPCHGSRFDLAGRVYKGVPAPTNLVVPPYRYVSANVVEIGVGPTDVEGA